MYNILCIAGARPNFMKISAITKASEAFKDSVSISIIHTGQHYDDALSRIFFDQFNMPEPIANLGVGSGSREKQTLEIIEKLSVYVDKIKPDVVLVVGDVNSTVAATMATIKKGIPVAHVEAGLRSHNWRMPEESNRVLTDHLSSLLYVTEPQALENLKKENLDDRATMVGNVMVDTMMHFEDEAEKSQVLDTYHLKPYEYALLTMHRPENVNNKERFKELFGAICEANASIKIVCPLHPRTKKASEEFGIDWSASYAPLVIPPVSYFDFLKLERYATCIITDSGGVQEEASMFGVPCVTIRTETERPITVTHGTNKVVGVLRQDIVPAITHASQGKWQRKKTVIPMWDGNSAHRILTHLLQQLQRGIKIPDSIAHYAKQNMSDVLEKNMPHETIIHHT